jgi:hypothetical protein
MAQTNHLRNIGGADEIVHVHDSTHLSTIVDIARNCR